MSEPSTPARVSILSTENFLKTILKSGIIGRDELQDVVRDVPREERRDAESLADFLVRKGTLTRFQASKLLRGMSVGLVLGPYQVLAPLGKGGMGTVYLARDSRSHLMVALKVLPPKRAREEERILARFRREMEMCQRVSHPHLAWAYEVGLSRGVHYIALEYIPGKSLFRLVQSEGPLSVPRTARLFAEVCSALEHAHSQGLIHRDLKPSNIMITPHDHAKVLDLGLALVQGEAPADREVVGGVGYVVGTMDYIAPEQAENASAVDPTCDIYSLGCSLYFALTGQPPFPGGTPIEKIQKHKNADPPPIPQLNPGVAPAFIGIVRKMMAKQPAQRYSTATEVREKLLSWASEDFSLPLDEKTDQEYQAAVEELEQADPPSELVLEVLPVVDEEASPSSVEIAAVEKIEDIEKIEETQEPGSRVAFYGILSGLAVTLLVLAVGLLVFFLRNRR